MPCSRSSGPPAGVRPRRPRRPGGAGRRSSMESPRWNIITPSQYEWERRGLDFIRKALPDHDPYRAWSNFEFQTGDGAIYEVDLLVLTKQGFWLVESKAWEGRISGDSGTWTRSQGGKTRSEDNPVLLANRKAKALSSLLKSQSAVEQGPRAVARRPGVPLRRRPPVRPHRPGPQPGLPQGPACRRAPPRAQGHPRRPHQPGRAGDRPRTPLDHRHQGRQGAVPSDGAGGHPPLAAVSAGRRLRPGRPDRRWAGVPGPARQARVVRERLLPGPPVHGRPGVLGGGPAAAAAGGGS